MEVMVYLRQAFVVLVLCVSLARFAPDTNVCKETVSTSKGRTFLVLFSDFYNDDFRCVIYIGSAGSGSANITKHIDSSSTTDIHTLLPGINEITISSPNLVQTSEGKHTKLLRIESTVDIAVYMTGFTRDDNYAAAYTVFPERTWSEKYVVPSFKPDASFKNVLIISSLYHNTSVHISNTKLNYSINTTIKTDESYAFMKTDDISGTMVESNTPVSLLSQSQCAHVPEHSKYCNTLIDSPIPVDYWDSEYIVPPLTPRLGYIVRVFTQDNETVSILLKNRTHSINRTFTGMYEVLLSTDALVIKTDRKVSVVQYGLSNRYDNIDGDSFMASVPGIVHYSKDVFIPAFLSRDGFITTIAVTIKNKHLSGLLLDGQPVDLQTAKTTTPVQPYGDFRIISLNLTKGNHNLSHSSAEAKFSVALYGRKAGTGYGIYLGFTFNKDECNIDRGDSRGQYCLLQVNITSYLMTKVKVCENGGLCTGSTTCQCLEGYTGDRCQFDINECLNAATCRNGATCINTAGNFTCLCSDGWNGRHCETDLDECMNASTCQHGGNCINTIGSYSCHCFDGWTGLRCEIDVNECSNSSTCVNGATCINTDGSFTCVCSNGWTGKYCETDTDECLNVSTCLNGATCFNNPGSYTCRFHCSGGWTDKPCETAIPTCFACDYTSSLSFCDSIEHCTGNQTCRQHEHDASSDDTCLHCCSEDFCNSHGCGDNGFPPKQSRGPLCLDCTHVSDPKECDQMTMCSSDEMCRIEELPWGDNSIYHLGCASVHDCAVESNSLGRRSSNYLSSRSVPVCTECCHGDFCNQNCTRKGHQQQIIVG